MHNPSTPHKRCSKCDEVKSIDMFNKHKGKKDSLTSWCKTCLAIPKPAIVTVQPAEKQCRKCGVTKPIDMFYKNGRQLDGAGSHCKKCVLKTQKVYQEKNPETRLEYLRAWRKANLEHHRAYSRAWQKAHPERARANHRLWSAKNIEHKRACNRAWQKAHPDVIRAKTQKRINRIRGNGGVFTHKELTAMRIAQAGICTYCQYQYDVDSLTIDHILPIIRGRRHEAANICLACGICNSSKGSKTPDEWIDRWYLRK